MHEDEKLRFILITSAIVAALAIHRLIEATPATGQVTGVPYFFPAEFGFVLPRWDVHLSGRSSAQELAERYAVDLNALKRDREVLAGGNVKSPTFRSH